MPDLRVLPQETVGHGLAAREGFLHVQNHAIQQCRLELKLFEEFNYLGILLHKGRGCADRQPGCQKVGRTQLAFAAYDSVPTSLIKWILLDFVELVLGHQARRLPVIKQQGPALVVCRTDGRIQRRARACPKIGRSEEHTSELQSLMRISYAVFCLKKKTTQYKQQHTK